MNKGASLPYDVGTRSGVLTLPQLRSNNTNNMTDPFNGSGNVAGVGSDMASM